MKFATYQLRSRIDERFATVDPARSTGDPPR